MIRSFGAFCALAFACAAACAQSSVTIYGKVDLGLVLDSGNSAGKSVRISSGVSGGSRLGFKGVEDLGGGMKAAFQLETGYCADSSANTAISAPAGFCTGGGFMGRQAHGDLTGPWGAVSAGRMYSLDFVNLTTIDPFGTAYAGDTQNLIGDKATTRVNNAVHYTTPTFGGLSASLELSLGERTGDWQSGRTTGASLNWAQGPAYVGFSYLDWDNAVGGGSQRRNYILGGTYDFGVVKLHALAMKATGSPTGARRIDTLDLLGGVTVPLAGGSLIADYIRHDDRTSLDEGGDRDAGQLGLGYIYPLSKRTSVYTSFAHMNNRHGATFTVGNATDAGTGDKAFDFGVSHNF